MATPDKNTAWILQVSHHHRVAVGQRELLHLADAAETFDVPLAPAHCAQVVLWRDNLLPLMDIAYWLGVASTDGAKKYIGILGYQDKRGAAPQFGALWLAAPPVRATVSDDQACPLSPDAPWSRIAACCFNDGHGPVPILDIHRLFSRPLDTRFAIAKASQPLPVEA